MKLKELDSKLEKKLSNVVLTLIKDKEQLNKVHKAYKNYAGYLGKVKVIYPSSTSKLFMNISDTFQRYKNNYKRKKGD